MEVKIKINRKSVESMTSQLTDQLRDLIGTGKLAIGSMLPSERTLANSLGVARNVVRGSYEYLEKMSCKSGGINNNKIVFNLLIFLYY